MSNSFISWFFSYCYISSVCIAPINEIVETVNLSQYFVSHIENFKIFQIEKYLTKKVRCEPLEEYMMTFGKNRLSLLSLTMSSNSDLGHSRSRKVSCNNNNLLSRCRCSSACIWRNKPKKLCQHSSKSNKCMWDMSHGHNGEIFG